MKTGSSRCGVDTWYVTSPTSICSYPVIMHSCNFVHKKVHRPTLGFWDYIYMGFVKRYRDNNSTMFYPISCSTYVNAHSNTLHYYTNLRWATKQMFTILYKSFPWRCAWSNWHGRSEGLQRKVHHRRGQCSRWAQWYRIMIGYSRMLG